MKSDWLSHAIQENFGRAARNQYNLEVLLAPTHYSITIGVLSSGWRKWTGYWKCRTTRQIPRRRTPQSNFPMPTSSACRLRPRVAVVFQPSVTSLRRDDFPKDVLLAIEVYFHVLDDTKDHWAARTVNSIEEFAKFTNLPMPALD
jgi:hypothetical protein